MAMSRMMCSKNQAVCAMRRQKPAIRAEKSYRTVEKQAESSSPTQPATHTASRLWLRRDRAKQFAFSLHLQILTLQAQEVTQEETER
jgi:hypothetical protein